MGDMCHLWDSEFIDNATLIRMRAEGGIRLEELGKQTNILVKAFRLKHLQATTETMGNDHVSSAGS